jgi:hypothetical protein
VAHELLVRDVLADRDVAEEAAAPLERLPLEGLVEALDLLMVGRDPGAQQPPGRGQALEQVDLDVAARPQQAVRGERARRAGADDGHTMPGAHHQAAVRSAVLFSAKNSAFSSSA